MIRVQIFTLSFREKYETKVTWILCQFEGIQVILDGTGIVDIYAGKTTRSFLGLPIFIVALKSPKLSILFDLSGKMSQILGPKNETFSVSWYTEFTVGMVNWELCLRLYWRSFFFSNYSVIIGGDRHLLAIYISMTRSWIFLL